jgi:recombination associated protein RdgC
MFKNALLYRIEAWEAPALPALDERLAAAPFVECAPSQPESAGWVAPRGAAHASLVESVAGQLIFKLCQERKAVPGGVVRRELEAALDAAERDTGRRPKGKRAKELKEDVLHRLLPRAFAQRSEVLVWADPAAGLLLVGVGSAKKADSVVTRLLEGLGPGTRLAPLQTALSPATAMAEWLSSGEAPAGFSIDRDCELKQPDSEKATVRYARHRLEIEEVVAHIQEGKRPTRLGLTWNGRVSFELTDTLALKKIKLLDVVLEDAGRAAGTPDGPDASFDADVALSTGELRQLLPALLEALGGLQTPGEAAQALQASAEPGAQPTALSAPPAGAAAPAGRPRDASDAPWDDVPA